MRKAITALATAALLAIASTALAGGWAVTSFENLPDELEAGTTYTLDYTVRAHGKTPVDAGPSQVVFRQEGSKPVQFRGNDGFWIEGAPHIIFYQDERGAKERARLAANVLAWEEDGVTHRIETTLGLDDALRLAESLRPIS